MANLREGKRESDGSKVNGIEHRVKQDCGRSHWAGRLGLMGH